MMRMKVLLPLLVLFTLGGCDTSPQAEKAPAVESPLGDLDLLLGNTPAVMSDDAGRVVVVVRCVDGTKSWALVSNGGAPAWKAIPIRDENASPQDKPWMENPRIGGVNTGGVAITDKQGRVMLLGATEVFGMGPAIVLVRDGNGQPLWKKVPVLDERVKASEASWFESPQVSVAPGVRTDDDELSGSSE